MLQNITRIALVLAIIVNGLSIIINPNGPWVTWNLFGLVGCAIALIVPDYRR